MQYVIQVNGEVANRKSKAYVVNSTSEEEANKIATQNFCEEYCTKSDEIHSKIYKRTKKAIWTCIIMLIPILLSFINWKNGHETISIRPDYISALYGILIYAAFVIRFKGIQRTTNSGIDILFGILNILLIATFIKTILVTKTISFFGIGEISIRAEVILPFAIVLSWLGLKIISLSCMGIIGIMALSNITALNTAMGPLFGTLYIICSFIGIILYLSIEPAFIEAMNEIGNVTTKGLNYLNRDLYEAKTNIKKINSSKKD